MGAGVGVSKFKFWSELQFYSTVPNFLLIGAGDWHWSIHVHSPIFTGIGIISVFNSLIFSTVLTLFLVSLSEPTVLVHISTTLLLFFFGVLLDVTPQLCIPVILVCKRACLLSVFCRSIVILSSMRFASKVSGLVYIETMQQQ